MSNEFQKATPIFGNVPTTFIPGGKTAGGSPIIKDANNVVANISLVTGFNSETQALEPFSSISGAMPTTDSGFYPDLVTFIYYVRDADYTLYQEDNRLYVADSLGRHKKIVAFRKGSTSNDLAQVTILYYQVPAFPTKITSIQTFYDKVQYYIDVNDVPFYDYNSAAQQNITPNP